MPGERAEVRRDPGKVETPALKTGNCPKLGRVIELRYIVMPIIRIASNLHATQKS